MSAEQSAPQDEQEFDLAAALRPDDADAPEGDTDAEQPERRDEPGESSAAPAEPQQQIEQQQADPDADDPALPVEERIARTERRTAKAAQAEVEKARRQAATYKGLVTREQTRAKQIEAELEEAKRVASDYDGQRNKQWEELIARQSDPDTRAYYQREYDLDRKERDLANKEREATIKTKQAEELATHERTERLTALERNARESAVGELRQAVAQAAPAMGLTPEDYGDILNWLSSPEVELNAQHLPIFSPDPNQMTLSQYRENLLVRAEEVLEHRAKARQEQQAAQNRDKAKGVYRGDLAVGGGGARRQPTTMEEAGDELMRRLTAAR